MKLGMIVLAGGVGKRIGRPFPKQFLLLGGKPLVIHVLEKARVIAEIDRVVITCPEAHLDETRRLLANHGFDARFSCILGGESRQESVRPRSRGARGLHLGHHPRGGPTAGHHRRVPSPHRGRGPERDVRHPDPVHGPEGP